ncbi:MAG: hypothetical protein HXY34_11600 [Candidatus Thorarchaeota archaeon]|nr:hypothetical protein [Candidatus Thorarchaeota archaeon]
MIVDAYGTPQFDVYLLRAFTALESPHRVIPKWMTKEWERTKDGLMSRDDEVGVAFRERLDKWHGEHHQASDSSDESGPSQDYVASPGKHTRVETIVHDMVDSQVSDEFIDAWLWRLFDKFEETPAGPPGIGLRRRHTYKDYVAGRKRLMTRDDAAGQAFRD